MAFNPIWADSIAKIESGGNYGLLGPVTKNGDRAYGKYQVMGNNIPVWTKEILGRSMTPEEFRADPAAQDAVFQGKFGQYAEKYGPEGAAQAWFGGPGAVGQTGRRDQLGTSVGDYGRRFLAGVNPDQPFGDQSLEPLKPLPPQPLTVGTQGNDKMDFLSALIGMFGQSGGSAPAMGDALSNIQQGGGATPPQGFQLPAFSWTPNQQQQQAQFQVPQTPAAPQFQPLAPMAQRPPDYSRILQTLSSLPSAIRPYSFRG